STVWWEAPSGPTVRPPWDETILTSRLGYATAFRIWSRHLPGTNAEYVLTKGIFPERASPAAIQIMFASSISTLQKRSGYRSANRLVFIEMGVLAPRTSSLVFLDPCSRSAVVSAS